MGCKELIESLRKAGDERIRLVRREAEQETARIRAEADSRVAKAREANERRHTAEAERQSAAILATAQAEARRIRIHAERVLADRLLATARASLISLRNVGYDDLFAGFVRELPREDWKQVRVNDEDIPLVRQHFPGAQTIADKTITGGFAVSSEGDRVRVNNTFETRLERLWEEMLPEIVAEARETIR